MALFLERIACLCDGRGTPPQPKTLADAVRSLAKQQVTTQAFSCLDIEGQPVDSVWNDRATVDASKEPFSSPLLRQLMGCEICAVTSSSPITPPEAECYPPASPEVVVKPITCSSPVTLAGAERYPFDSLEIVKKTAAKDYQSSQSAADREDAAKIEQEFTVPLLSFIDQAGKISRVESPLEQFFGAGLRRLRHHSCFQASCMQAMTGKFAQFVDSHYFKILSAIVIMLNYYFIIHQTDYKMSHLNQPEPSTMFVIEVCFTVFYVWELSCQVITYRKEFFLGHEMMWNLFDMAIVFVSVFELVVTLSGGKAINLSFLRVLRFLKISRVLRMFSALRLMKEIRIMVDALAGSFLIFVFCSIMLAMFYSIFAIFFVQGMTTYLEDAAEVDKSVLHGIHNDFGSVSSTMLSLFMSVTGGNDWSQYHDTVAAVGTSYKYLWLFFIGFSTIAFLNVITGVFAQKAMSLAMPTVDELMVRRTAKEVRDAKELVALLHRIIGSEGTCSLSSASFEKFLAHHEVVKYLEVRGLKPCSARRFFMLLLEIHQTDRVDFGTFVSACVKLDGSASSIDLHVLSAELKAMQLKQSHLNQFLRQNIPKISTCDKQPSQVISSRASFYASDWRCVNPDLCVQAAGDEVPVENLEEHDNTSSSTMLESSNESSLRDSVPSSSQEMTNEDFPAIDLHVVPEDPSLVKPLSSPLMGSRGSSVATL
jgi:hypothetical protein